MSEDTTVTPEPTEAPSLFEEPAPQMDFGDAVMGGEQLSVAMPKDGDDAQEDAADPEVKETAEDKAEEPVEAEAADPSDEARVAEFASLTPAKELDGVEGYEDAFKVFQEKLAPSIEGLTPEIAQGIADAWAAEHASRQAEQNAAVLAAEREAVKQQIAAQEAFKKHDPDGAILASAKEALGVMPANLSESLKTSALGSDPAFIKFLAGYNDLLKQTDSVIPIGSSTGREVQMSFEDAILGPDG